MRDDTNQALASGIYAALVTPRRPGTIEADTAAYLEYLDRVSQGGVDGLVFFGSTGEFTHFDTEERMRVTGLAVKRSRVPVLVNVSHTAYSGVRMLTEHAVDSGAAGVLVTPPYFYSYDASEIAAFYRQFAEEMARDNSRVPLYLYNLPQFSPAIPGEVMEELLGSGAYAGIKDSSGEAETFADLVRLRSRRTFRLLAGTEGIYTRNADVDGAVSGVAAAVPELMVAFAKAVTPELGARIEEFSSWVARFPATIVIKEAVQLRGWAHTSPAVPLDGSTCERLVAFRSWFQQWLPATLETCKAS